MIPDFLVDAYQLLVVDAIILELQALASSTSFGTPRRGFAKRYNRRRAEGAESRMIDVIGWGQSRYSCSKSVTLQISVNVRANATLNKFEEQLL